MSKKIPSILPQAIRDLVKNIEAGADNSDDHTLETAMLLR